MRFILRRLGFYLVAFWVSITLNFLLPRLMPGDPVSRMLSPFAGPPGSLPDRSLRQLLGARRPPVVGAVPPTTSGGCFTGNLGISISRFPTPVTEVIGSQIGWTLLLGLTSLIIAVIIGNVLGILAAWRRGGASWTRSCRRS